MKIFALAVGCLIIFINTSTAVLCNADNSVWEQTNGPVGGAIRTVEFDPIQNNVAYAAGLGGGLYISSDSGNSWRFLQNLTVPVQPILDIVISPTIPHTIYVLTGQLFRSRDGGQSSIEIGEGRRFRCLAIEQSNPLHLVAGTWDCKVYRTTDGAQTWQDVSGSFTGDQVRDIAISGTSEYWIGTTGATDGFLYHTTDAGRTWRKVNIGQTSETCICSILVDQADNNTVYVGLMDVYNKMFHSDVDTYLLKTTDGGATWTQLRLPRTDSTIALLGQNPTHGTIYVGSGGNLFKSTDGGKNWIDISPQHSGADGAEDMAVHPLDDNILLLPTLSYGGILMSTDGGRNWRPSNEGLRNTVVPLLAVPDVPGSATLYAHTDPGVTFKTLDRGDTWIRIAEHGLTHPWTDELVISPDNEQVVWSIGDVPRVFETTNGGDNWSEILGPSCPSSFRFSSIYAMAAAPSDPDRLYALKNGFGIFKSTNRGDTWEFLRKSEVDYTYSIAVHPTNHDIIYSGYLPKPFEEFAMVRRSLDGGDSWETVLYVPDSRGITSVVIDPIHPNIVYAGSIGKPGRIYRSTDGGDSWLELSEQFNMCTVWGQPQLVVDPYDPLTAYAATWLAGIWKTTDAGETWDLLEDAPVSSTALSLNRLNSHVIYCADRTKPKIWKSTDAGIAWKETADFSSDGAFLVNRVLADGSTVYASTFGPTMHGGRLYRSTNSGSSWIDITGNLPRSVLDLAVDPTNPGIIYLTTHIYGAYKSNDGGTTWVQLHDFPDIGAYDVEVDPVDPTIVYACGLGGCSVPDWCIQPDGYTFTDDPGVYKSYDAGFTWSKILTTSNECRAIRIHPGNHNMLFAAAMDDGLQVSTDGGNSWASYNADLNTRVLTSCAVSGDNIYVGSQACGVHSGDLNTIRGSVTWRQDRSNKPVPEVHSLQIQVDPTNPSRIFVGSNPGGLYRSDDGGATFYDKNFLTPSVVVDDPLRQGYYTFAINPSNTNEVWLGTWGKGIYKSYDGMDFNIGANGTDMKMYGKHINQVLISGGKRFANVYVATEEGVFSSNNGGASWQDFSSGLDTLQARILARSADGTLYCGTLGYEVYYYDNTSGRWRQMELNRGSWGVIWPIWDRPFYQYTSLLFDPEDPNTVYFGTFPAGIYKSVDGGKSWREHNVGWSNDGVFCLTLHPYNHDLIYAGTYNGVSRSSDAGEHWETCAVGWPSEQWVFSIDFDPLDPNIMYACSKNGENKGKGRPGFNGTVMKSTNGGDNWFSITNGLRLDQEYYKIIVDKYLPTTLYLASQSDGVFISRDSGSSWASWNEGLTNTFAGTNGNNVSNTMIMTADGSYLYFGTAGSGVFRRWLGIREGF